MAPKQQAAAAAKLKRGKPNVKEGELRKMTASNSANNVTQDFLLLSQVRRWKEGSGEGVGV